MPIDRIAGELRKLRFVYVWRPAYPIQGNIEDRLRSCKTASRSDHICERYRGCKSPRRASESSQVDHYARCSRNFVFPIPGAHFVLRRAGETRSIHRWFPGVPLYTFDCAPNYPTEYRARSRTLFPQSVDLSPLLILG